MRLAGLATALLALAAVVAAQSDPCTLTSAADKTALLCAGAVGSVKTPNGTLSLKDAVKSAASAPLLELTFSGIAFTGSAFAEAAQAVAHAGGNKPVLVTLNNCTMTRQVAYLPDVARIPSGASYFFTLSGCRFTRNQLVSMLAFGANGALSASAALSNSEVTGNQLISLAAGMVRGRGDVNLGLNSSTVADNQVISLGALAVRENGDAAIPLAGSTVEGNMLLAAGLAALGGSGGYSSTLKSSQVGNNSAAAVGLFVEQQVLVKLVVDVIGRVAFQDASVNLTRAIGDIQTELCKIMPNNYTDRDLGLLGEVAQGVRSLLCGGAGGAPNLGALVPVLQQFIDELQNTAGLSFNNLLQRLGNIQSLIPLALPLLGVVGNLSLDKLLTPEVLQPILTFLLQLLAPQQ